MSVHVLFRKSTVRPTRKRVGGLSFSMILWLDLTKVCRLFNSAMHRDKTKFSTRLQAQVQFPFLYNNKG